MRLANLYKRHRERRQQLTEKENRLYRTLLTLRENSARALELFNSVGTLHEALLLANTDLCAELESENSQSACTRTAISKVSEATDSVQQSNEMRHVWDENIQKIIDLHKKAFQENMNAAHAVTNAYEQHLANENTNQNIDSKLENEGIHDYVHAHMVCEYCKSTINLQRAVNFGICSACAKQSWENSWESC